MTVTVTLSDRRGHQASLASASIPPQPEMRLLLDMISGRINASDAHHKLSELDGDHFANLVRYHRVEALTHDALRGSPSARPWDQAHLNNARYQLASEATARHLINAFDEAGIPCMIVKGATIADLAYGRPSMRRSIDIDLMIPPGAILQASDIAENAGFERFCPDYTPKRSQWRGYMQIDKSASFRRSRDEQYLDLHWRAFRNPRLWPDFNQQWQDWMVRPQAGYWHDLPRLPPAETLTYTLIHGAHTGWFRLKWLVDLDRLIRRLDRSDCDRALNHLLAADLSEATVAARDLCVQSFGTPFPPSWQCLPKTRRSNSILKKQTELLFSSLNRGDTKGDYRQRLHRFIDLRRILKPGLHYRLRQSLINFAIPKILRRFPFILSGLAYLGDPVTFQTGSRCE